MLSPMIAPATAATITAGKGKRPWNTRTPPNRTAISPGQEPQERRCFKGGNEEDDQQTDRPVQGQDPIGDVGQHQSSSVRDTLDPLVLDTEGVKDTFKHHLIPTPVFTHSLRTGAFHQVAKHERHDEHIVKWSDHRQELGQQVDRRDDPHERNPHEESRTARHSRVAEQPSEEPRKIRQEPGELLRLNPSAPEHQSPDHDQPRCGGDDESHDERVHTGSLDLRRGCPVTWTRAALRSTGHLPPHTFLHMERASPSSRGWVTFWWSGYRA